MTHTCETKCQYRGKLWHPGDKLVADKNEKVPEHFKPDTKPANKAADKPPAKPAPKPDTKPA
ncbi:hypothetical protein [Thalassospira tepidiphila]|uniref:Uncharacterized protein n=2 Tax=Thalassospira tepidiphila TaxID=393657 RepID=A0A853KWK3_9PROT|nr:hypothetical protein [Thalassospira tepidiphila]NJB74627.1 hypothetical protein [Thalassospira tepidiphila]OAZ08048.1 hypothetical protein TH4_18500 [Thalassospira tepidiphila MCCC 1A03514]